jgi:uncharacterized RDD family membrane protein YckC
MKCPSCGYLSFDDLDSCKKCGAELRSDRDADEGASFDLEEFFVEAGRDDADDGVRENAWQIAGKEEEEGDSLERSAVPEAAAEEPVEADEPAGGPGEEEPAASGSGIPWAEETGDLEQPEEIADREEVGTAAGDEAPPEGEGIGDDTGMAAVPDEGEAADDISPDIIPPGGSIIEELRREAASSLGVPGEVPEAVAEPVDESVEGLAEVPPTVPEEEPASAEGSGAAVPGQVTEDEVYFEDFPLDLESEEAVEALTAEETVDEEGIPVSTHLPEEPVEGLAEDTFLEETVEGPEVPGIVSIPEGPVPQTGEERVTGVAADEAAAPGIPVYTDETVEEAVEDEIHGDEAAVLWGEQPAGFAWRAAAFTIDNLIIALLNFVFLFGAALGLFFKGVSFSWLVSNFWVGDVLLPFYVLSLIISAAYFTYFHWSEGRTPGKRIFSIKVVNLDEEEITLAVAVTRWMAYLVSAVPLGLGFMWALFDEEGLAWHDRLTGTMVVGEADESA